MARSCARAAGNLQCVAMPVTASTSRKQAVVNIKLRYLILDLQEPIFQLK
jgi:hypothetical protein